MTIANKIEIIKGWINMCIEMRDLACMNFDLTNRQAKREFNYYQGCIARYEAQKMALELWV